MRPVSGCPAASLGVAVSCIVLPAETVAVAGATSTEATGAGAAVTVTCEVPLFPSLVAVTVALPTATPVTSPVADTVATWALSVVQVTVRPLSGSPPASWSAAESCTVAPTATLAGSGETATDATGITAGAAALISMPSAPPFSLVHRASIVLSPADRSASRADGGVSPDAGLAISVNPAPGVIEAELLRTPKTPYATSFGSAKAPSATVRPFTLSPRAEPD